MFLTFCLLLGMLEVFPNHLTSQPIKKYKNNDVTISTCFLVATKPVRTDRTTIPVGKVENHKVAFFHFPFLVDLLVCWVGWFREGLSQPARSEMLQKF